jgi:hypothetical protein
MSIHSPPVAREALRPEIGVKTARQVFMLSKKSSLVLV